ncbi:DUF4320 family protein [Paenibacillus polymyxa]|uniref:DUF4320 family protein n=1 Tax=Paenibacillus polymyxa TaxID=1406 RepID=UPI0032AFD3EB
MRRKLASFIRGEKGSGGAIVGASLIMYLIAIMVLTGVDTSVSYSIRDNIETAANESLQFMKMENGADSGTRVKFDELLRKLNVDPTQVTFTATPKLVQRGDMVEITATMQYERRSLKLLGMSNVTSTLKVHVAGYAHKYIRP